MKRAPLNNNLSGSVDVPDIVDLMRLARTQMPLNEWFTPEEWQFILDKVAQITADQIVAGGVRRDKSIIMVED